VGLLAIAVVVGIGVAGEGFRSVTRRILVREWAEDHHFTLLQCRHRPFGTWQNWLTSFDVRWQDDRGVEAEGRVLTTGLLRRKAWLDGSGTGRGLTA
jgi:hypothetical protein